MVVSKFSAWDDQKKSPRQQDVTTRRILEVLVPRKSMVYILVITQDRGRRSSVNNKDTIIMVIVLCSKD